MKNNSETSGAVLPVLFVIHPSDNVGTLLDDAKPGSVRITGAGEEDELAVTEAVSASHKIALRAIGEGEPVLKYGLPIGRATAPIPRGAWVHLHNCASSCDERSSTLDLHSGAPSDTASSYV